MPRIRARVEVMIRAKQTWKMGPVTIRVEEREIVDAFSALTH